MFKFESIGVFMGVSIGCFNSISRAYIYVNDPIDFNFGGRGYFVDCRFGQNSCCRV